MNINYIKEKIQQLRKENILKMIPLQDHATRDDIAYNTKENEFRLGADAAYEMVLMILKDEIYLATKGD